MTVVTIIVADPTNPTEVQAWFNANPLAVVNFISTNSNLFYIFHT